MAYSSKGRASRATLTESSVRAIRLRAAEGASVRQLADEFGVGPETVRRILRWETWRWVSSEGPGASLEAWEAANLAPLTPQMQEDAQASLQRLLAIQGLSQPTGAGLARLQQEAQGKARVDEVLGELEQTPTPGKDKS